MTYNQQELKQKVAKASLKYIPEDIIVGIGSGSTVEELIPLLAKCNIKGGIASSIRTEEKLKQHNIDVYNINEISTPLELYIDSADEANKFGQLIKGGGGALTREKIIAVQAKKFICIIDESKLTQKLGVFPIPVEILPFARSYAAREIVKLGGNPVLRKDFTTDNGNIIIDIHNLDINQPSCLEENLNNISGIVCNGLFARRPADVIMVETQYGTLELGA